jgi:hypothetical protein
LKSTQPVYPRYTAQPIKAFREFIITTPPNPTTQSAEHDAQADHEEPTEIHEPRLWKANGWTAQVIKNDDDEGWAVAMIKEGEREPALIGPWTMGRDKKNPKPLDGNAFITLVKTASEFVRRHEQQLHASLHQSVTVTNSEGESITVSLDIVPDEDEPYATLSARDALQEIVKTKKVAPNIKLTRASALAWLGQD